MRNNRATTMRDDDAQGPESVSRTLSLRQVDMLLRRFLDLFRAFFLRGCAAATATGGERQAQK